ncbi:serine hydrolase domain-containing protein [Sorangium sp. So ce448]|uniref:serine hydrolase domain-containing protein n=1 Tax=Sorangium sp. So ce448 TaxID=3133314 RepID=UPI003F614693
MRASSLIFCGAAAAAFVGMAPSAHAQVTPHTYPLASTQNEHLRPDTAASVGLASIMLDQALGELQEAVDDGDIKGAVLLVARRGRIVLYNSLGTRDGLNENNPSMPSVPMPADGIFDLQSMTKPFTVFLAMKMQESGNYPGFNINNTVATYFPEFAVSSVNNKSSVTVKDLMAYISGEDLDYFPPVTDPGGIFDDADPWHTLLDAPLAHPRATKVVYSDLGYRILGHVLETVGGESLQDLMQTYIFGPLQMTDTGFQPWLNMPAKQDRFVGTAWSATRGRYLRGEVQDETDYFLEGDGPAPADHLTGCDGLFSTAMDLAKFAQMMLNRGKHRYPCTPGSTSICETTLLTAQAVLDMSTIRTGSLHLLRPAWTYSENLLYSRKGYGWEMWDGGSWPGGEATSSVAYSKTGGAGTLMVIDPEPRREMFAILLTNHGLPKFDEFTVDGTGKMEWPEFNWMINDIRALEVMNKVHGSIIW